MLKIKQDMLYNLLMNDNVVISDELFEIIDKLNIIKNFDQRSKYHHLNVLEHSILAINLSVMEFDVRVALLLHDIGKPLSYQVDKLGYYHYRNHAQKSYELSKIILTNLDYSNMMVDYVSKLILKHDEFIPNDIDKLDELCNIHSSKFMIDLINVRIADILAHNDYHKKMNADITNHLEKNLKIIKKKYR